MTKNITIYTSNTCASCMMVKKFLNIKGQKYEEINVDENPARRQEAIELSGARTTPVVVVTRSDNSRQISVGYNPAQLSSAIN